MGLNLLTPFDIIYSIILIFIIIGFSSSIVNKKIASKPYYKVYKKGLFIKMLGGVSFCLIYALYYKGGDTVNYYQGVHAMFEVFKNNPFKYFELFFHENDAFSRNAFYEVKSYVPNYMFKDTRTYTVIKISSLISLPALGGFLPTTILLAAFIYSWVWKLYSFMIERYPHKELAINISILYLPSTIFWGSGIMKDTYAFGATCYAVYGLNKYFIKKERSHSVLLQLIVSFYLIITVKAYIIFALLPGLLIFANFEKIKSIKSYFLKIIVIPFSIVLVITIANTILFDFDDLFGKYSADKLLEEAAVQNADLQRSVYGSNSFSIGEFEPTINGVLSKFVPAVNASIFRPYLWETGSPTMLISGIENLILLLASIYLLITKPVTFIKKTSSDPFLLFCILFTLILGFGVGLSTSNFGALVRYKIPFLPFFTFLILKFIIKNENNSSNSES
jgi:hypothetical protein